MSADFTQLDRRQFIAGTAAGAAALTIGMPAVHAQGKKSIKVGVYGGYFKESFEKHIFPDFTKTTGIEVESVAEPTSEAWVVQLETAARGGVAPADVSMIAQTAMLRGQTTELWVPIDMGKLPNAKFVKPVFVHKYPDGRVDGIGAVTWYITLVSNSKVIGQEPKSWAEFWDAKHKDQLGLLALASNSFLLEITATTFFGGTKVLDTKEGIDKVLAKIAELKPNVKLWYRDEAQFEQALKSGEIPMGQYYHDVTGLAIKDGFPVRTTFPKEGGVNDSGAWAISKASKKVEECHVFIDYMCQPKIQAALSRNVGTSPTVERASTDLTDAEFGAVSSDITPIIPRYDLYAKMGDYIEQKWTETITG